VILAHRVLRRIKITTFPSQGIKKELTFFLKLFDHTVEERKVLVRLLTFMKLELAHTCCHHDLVPRHLLPPLDDDEVREIQEEDSYLICKLDELMEDFIAQLEQPLFSSSLSDFIRGYWIQKIEEFKTEAGKGNSTETMHEAHKIGVTLHFGPEPSPASKDEGDGKGSSSDYWIKRIDAVSGL
jgi:hypothetical protein